MTTAAPTVPADPSTGANGAGIANPPVTKAR